MLKFFVFGTLVPTVILELQCFLETIDLPSEK